MASGSHRHSPANRATVPQAASAALPVSRFDTARTNKPLHVSPPAALPNEDAAQQAILAKLSPDLREIDPNQNLDVIVQFDENHSDAQHELFPALGATHKADLHLIHADLVHLKGGALAGLAADPSVMHISPDRKVHSAGNSIDPSTPVPAGPVINAHLAWQSGWSGKGIGVAVIDSGIVDTADLSRLGRVVYSENFIPGYWHTWDRNGHGTYMAGLIAGDGALSLGAYKGVAPKAHIVNLRVLDQGGSGTDSSIISAIDRSIQLSSYHNIRVINLSLGRLPFESYKVDPLCQAVEAAWKKGIVVVVAAGNEGRNNSAKTQGYGTITAPGNDPYVITVGAMKPMGTLERPDDLIASYSSKGPTLFDHFIKPDLVAPGNLIISLAAPNSDLVLKHPGNLIDPYYMQLSGTSGAAAVTSGAVALLLQQSPYLAPDQVKAVLMKSASKNFPVSSTATEPSTGETFTSYYDAFTIGAGYLDIASAMASAYQAQYIYGSAASPTAVVDQSGQVSMVNDPSTIWASTAGWSASTVWGSNIFIKGTVLWGDSVLWETKTAEGFSVVWGTGVVWGTSDSAVAEVAKVAIQGETNGRPRAH